MYHGWEGYGYGSQMGIWGWIGPIAMIILWVLIVVGLVAVIRYLWLRSRDGSAGGNSRVSRSPESAVEILKQRYARGEIDKEEFEQKKRDLS